ncbi:hypothetical protein BY996DRAFT_6415203 [Phakopsora pachyrhizi]|nr:hypothetical protein BY996DRAFT_6415203 [Phakopsora pachyrhizi]
MTSETIEKRKQQNRTAQKAFRERKEKHLRDVEGQLNYKQQQLQSLHDQNQYLQQKYKFLWEQYEILKKKLDQAESQLKESSNSAVLYSEIVKSLDTENFNTVEGAKFIF